jgi:hypothetical protein
MRIEGRTGGVPKPYQSCFDIFVVKTINIFPQNLSKLISIKLLLKSADTFPENPTTTVGS